MSHVLAALAVFVAVYSGFTTAAPAQAAPLADLIDCGDKDAPIPASPYGDGSFIVRPSTAETELPAGHKPGEIVKESDPFSRAGQVSLESVYGTAPQWWVYDTGCTGKFVAGAGTALANIELQVAGILPSWSHALLDTVIGDSELFSALDAPVKASTEAVAGGVWGPWLPVALLGVAGLVLWRARSGHLGGAVTAAATALVVLGLTSVLLSYPTESVRLVDAGVRNVTGMIAAGFSEGKVMPSGGASEDAAADAIDTQMDDIVRDTHYRTWASGVFGDPDTAVAREYGPQVFRSTHFSWAEYAVYRSDPTGDGKQILEAKQSAFKKSAEEIKRADPVAYESFTGKKWTKRATSALVNLFVICIPCLFLLLAGLFAVMGFVLIRLVVPLAPAAGVIFMFDTTRDLAVGWLKRVVGPLVMGPVCLLVALLLLRFTSAIFDVDEMWFVLKLGLIAVLTLLAFHLSGVLGMVPGYEQFRRRVRTTLGQALGTAAATAAGSQNDIGQDRVAQAPTSPNLESSPGGVYHPNFEVRAPGAPPALEPPEGFVPYVPPARPLGAGSTSSHDAAPAAPRAVGELQAPGNGADSGVSAKPTRTKGKLPSTGDPGSYGYDDKGRRLPYANGRPDFARGQVLDVWENAKNADGEVWVLDDENVSTRIDWTPGESRRNVWDMGHTRGNEYRDLRDMYLGHEISKDDFIEEYQDPDNYEVQHWKRNQSHIDEAPGPGQPATRSEAEE